MGYPDKKVGPGNEGVDSGFPQRDAGAYFDGFGCCEGFGKGIVEFLFVVGECINCAWCLDDVYYMFGICNKIIAKRSCGFYSLKGNLVVVIILHNLHDKGEPYKMNIELIEHFANE